MQVREYRETDYDGVREVLRQNGMHNPRVDTQDIFRQRVGRDLDAILVAEEDGRIVGTVFIVHDPWLSAIHRLSVAPGEQRRGIGSALLESAKDAVYARGAPRVALYVEMADANLRRFYRDRGFEARDPAWPMVHYFSQDAG